MNMEQIKTSIDEFVILYPAINDPLTNIANKAGIDKALVVIGGAILVLILMFFIFNTSFLMLVLLNLPVFLMYLFLIHFHHYL